MAREITEGYYWWRGKEGDEFELCQVKIDPYDNKPIARFFNGSKIIGCNWGEWFSTIVKSPVKE